MQLHNFHTHTVYSDGHDTPEEMISAAIGLDFTALGFSDHSWAKAEEDYCMSPEKIREYYAEIRGLREKYGDKIKIYAGIEQDSESALPEYDYDYVISSVHEMVRRGISMPVDESADKQRALVSELFGGSYLDFARSYFEKVTENVMRNKTDIVGHFDLLTKFSLAPEDDEEYIKSALEAAGECVKYCRTFELNTGAIARGLRSVPYPAGFIADEIKRLGGRFIVTSDCHYRAKLNCWFNEAEDFLSSHGFVPNDNGSLNDKVRGIRIWE